MPRTQEELEQRQAEIRGRLQELDTEFAGAALPDAERSEWNTLNEELDANDKLVTELRARRERVEALADNPEAREAGAVFHTRRPNATTGDDIYDLSTVRMSADSPESADRELCDRAMRSADMATIHDERVDPARAKERVERLVQKHRGPIARYLLSTGSPLYERAFGKALSGAPLNSDETRALSISGGSGSAGGYAVPYALDPTVIMTSNSSVNPLRSIARVETISQGNTWQGITSAGLTSTYGYAAEATQSSDNSPVLTQPEITVQKAQAFVPMSIEIQQDWAGIAGELARMFADAKDDVEADKFITGAGDASDEPQGLLTGATTEVDSDDDEKFAVDDLYAMEAALPDRFLARASWVAHRGTYGLIRQFASADGPDVYVERLRDGTSPTPGDARVMGVLGYPAYRASSMPTMPASFTDDVSLMVFGDFRHFLIVDKIGMSVEAIPHLFGANQRPTGQRGVYAYWRNTSRVLAPAAFRVLNITEVS